MSIYENMDYFQIMLFTATCWKFQKIQQPYIKRYCYVFFSTNIVEILLKLRADASSGSGAFKAFLQGSSSPSPSPSSSLLFSIFVQRPKDLDNHKVHIFTKGFNHIECGRFLKDHAGFHEHNEPRVVLYKLWHDLINSHKVTKHACTFSCLPLATQCTTYTMTLQLWTNNKTNKSYRQTTPLYIYINISCKCDTNRARHLTLDAYASRPVACN